MSASCQICLGKIDLTGKHVIFEVNMRGVILGFKLARPCAKLYFSRGLAKKECLVHIRATRADGK